MIKSLWIPRRYRHRTRFDRFAHPTQRTVWGRADSHNLGHVHTALLRRMLWLLTNMGIGKLILAEALRTELPRFELPRLSGLLALQLDFLGRDP